MSEMYPQGPVTVPANLAAPTKTYRRQAWIAMAMLALFVAFYLSLAGWFGWKGWSMLSAFASGTANPLLCLAVGLPAAFLAVFMLKALFFVKRGHESKDMEVTAAQQPRLFAFLHRLADEAGAPRPHRVFVSPRVNAAVFYDLSVLNLFVPSRKNLEIGLGLANVLSLGELKAVLAHEFGHFAQRSMAVGRWVYIAQQIADHVVGRRDALDRFLQGLSRVDLRVAWVGWLLRLIVWSIRSLLEQLFRGVVLAQRALSREMEMQADLVAVSLTGSDALIHALHKAQAADDAWDRTIGFAEAELGRGRLTADLFAVQTRMLEHLRRLFGEADYGVPPALPAQGAAAHRVFKSEMAQPPRMWLTHPLNHEREENAKRIYLAVPEDERSTWALFDDTDSLRREVSLSLVSERKVEPTSVADTLQSLDSDFSLESLQPRYRGVYLGRSVVRGAERTDQLVDTAASGGASEFDELYPEEIADRLDQRRQLQRELGMLESLRDGRATATGGVIRHRGRDLGRRALPETIGGLKSELLNVEQSLATHDRRCRGVHRAAARRLGEGWDAYLEGLLRVLHFAEHVQADLRDAQGALANAYAVVTADGRVTDSERFRLLQASQEMHRALVPAYGTAADMELAPSLLARLGGSRWAELLGEFKLVAPSRENLGDWLSAIDGWTNAACAALRRLSGVALEQLLSAEAQVSQAVRSGTTLDAAPTASRVPDTYPTRVAGTERPLQTRLDWWDRFQTADGYVAGTARLALAGAIVAGVVGASVNVGSASLQIYNGLGRPVHVSLGSKEYVLGPHATVGVDLPPDITAVEARTSQGKVVERFDIASVSAFSQYVYNVAAATPMVVWVATYGNASEQPDVPLGAQRWFANNADVLFAEPPASVSTKGGGGTRTVLSAYSDASAENVIRAIEAPAQQASVIAAHVRWDDSKSRHLLSWLMAATSIDGGEAWLRERLASDPDDVAALRALQDLPGEAHERACDEQRQRADAAPEHSGLQYLKVRCDAESEAKDAAFVAGHRRWPNDPWFANAAGYSLAEAGDWSASRTAFEAALRESPSLGEYSALVLARVIRAQDFRAKLAPALVQQSSVLARRIELERALQYVKLHEGEYAAALTAVEGDADEQPRVLRLVAASSGADAALAKRALALEELQGFDPGTIGASIGLSLRERSDPEPMLVAIDGWDAGFGVRLRRFVTQVQAGNPVAAEAEVQGMSPDQRGQAFVLGSVALGERAPAAWRTTARGLLFASERPRLD